MVSVWECKNRVNMTVTWKKTEKNNTLSTLYADILWYFYMYGSSTQSCPWTQFTAVSRSQPFVQVDLASQSLSSPDWSWSQISFTFKGPVSSQSRTGWILGFWSGDSVETEPALKWQIITEENSAVAMFHSVGDTQRDMTPFSEFICFLFFLFSQSTIAFMKMVSSSCQSSKMIQKMLKKRNAAVPWHAITPSAGRRGYRAAAKVAAN